MDNANKVFELELNTFVLTVYSGRRGSVYMQIHMPNRPERPTINASNGNGKLPLCACFTQRFHCNSNIGISSSEV